MNPDGIWDLASLSFQVPMLGFWAKHTAAATKHSARDNMRVLAFMTFSGPAGISGTARNYTPAEGALVRRLAGVAYFCWQYNRQREVTNAQSAITPMFSVAFCS